MTSQLFEFLAAEGSDHAGRRHADVLALDDQALEQRHDFIQWLFPLPEPSRAVPGAPVMSADDLALLQGSPEGRARLRRSAERMLTFYRANRHWQVRRDHNHLRITRIFRSLRLILGDGDADAFRREILRLAEGAQIDPTALAYWRDA